MPPAIVHYENQADRQGIWRDAMPHRTAEALKQKYPEAEITATASPDRRASCHSKNIPEARLEMIFGFLSPALAITRRQQIYFNALPF